MWNSIRTTLLVICLSIYSASTGQNYFTSNITTQDGLPSNRITCFAKSPKEFLWIGTDKGLVKLGQEIMVSTTDHGLPSNKISALHVVDGKRIWIGTSDKGISLYNNGAFENYSTMNGLVGDEVTQLYYSTEKKLLFIGTYNGLSVLDEGRFINFGDDENKPWHVSGFLENDTSLWISTQHSGWHYYSFRRKQVSPLHRKYRCYEDSTYAIHVTTQGDTLIACGNGHLKILSANSLLQIDLQKRITMFASNSTGACWVLAQPMDKESQNELYILKNDLLIPFGRQLTNVSSNQISTLLIDETDGALIIGTRHRGAYIWPGFTFERYESTERCGPLHDICEDEQGNVWILGNRLMKLNPTKEPNFSHKNLEEALDDKTQWFTCDSKCVVASNQQVYVGCNNKIWQTSGSKPLKLTHITQLGDTALSVIALDNHLLINHRHTISLRETPSLKLIGTYPLTKELHSAVEIGQRIWVLDKEKNLYCFNKKNLALVETDQTQALTTTLANKIIKDKMGNLILEDEQGNIWFHHIDAPSPTPKRNCLYQNEFVGNNLMWMLCDDENNLWLGTDMGLSMVDLNSFYQTGKAFASNWGKGEGYVSNESFKAIQVRNGYIWVLSENKVMRFNPHEIKKIIRTPLLKLSSISVMGNTGDDKDIEGGPTPKSFKYKHNSLVFSFDVANLLNKDRVLYQFRLVPGNTAWSAPSKQSFVYLSDLQPGKYTLTVKAWFQHAPNNPALITYDFMVKQPWYFNIYANVFYTCVIILILIFLFDIKIKRVKKQEAYRRANAEKVALLKMEALQAQMNPHFIFNALNSLQYNILENNTEYSLEFLGEFSKLIRSTLDNASQHFISLKEELLYIENYMKVEQMRYSKKFYYSISMADGLNPDALYVPPMIIQPHVENAIKYAFSTSIGYIIISFSKIHDKLICMVEDNGVGRKQTLLHKKTHKSKGQSITSQRFEMLNQYYQTENEYRYEIEDLHDDEGSPSGTRVTLYFPLVGPHEAMEAPVEK